MNKIKLLALITLPIIFSLYCGKSKEPDVLSSFDGGQVLLDSYIEYYLSSTKYKPEDMPTEENLKHIVTLKALEKMAVLEAIDIGIEKDSLFIESVENNKRKTLFYKYMREEIINAVINDSLMKAYYTNFTPQHQVSYIVRPVKLNSVRALEVSQRDSINLAYKMLRDGSKWEEIVVRFSQDISTNERGGNLGYVTSESLGDAELRKALKTLTPYTYSKPIRGYEAYYIMYKGDRRDVTVPPFEQAQGKIWQSLYRSRKHDIQSMLDIRFNMLAEKYNYSVDQDSFDKILEKAGFTKSSFIASELNFTALTEADMNSSLATYKDGEIKVYELFEETNREPGNKLEFQERFDTVKERHLLSKHSMELGYENDAEFKEKLKDVRISLLRSFLHKRKVVDKAKTAKNIVQQDNNEFQEAAVRRQLKEELEEEMKKKYNFEFVEGNFGRALKIAKEKKIEQILEQEKQKARTGK